MIKNYLFLFASLVLISACQTVQQSSPFVSPSNATIIKATFKHLVINQTGNTRRLHVYIEGDGIPFKNRFQIASDPSPSNPLMLQLMSLDNSERLYLGRPCYYARSLIAMTDEQCNPGLWTTARYSDEVVNSMVNALRQHLAAHPAQGVTLIGHSGGGTLVLLMAARMSEVDQIVTLAGNLDIQAWTRLHHYTSLKNSLNPADLPVRALPARQIHYGGDKDDNIPPALGQKFLTPMGQSLRIINNADHICCWFAHWNELLGQINQQMAP
jgi:predicted alpha/beta hydrolase family esterase